MRKRSLPFYLVSIVAFFLLFANLTIGKSLNKTKKKKKQKTTYGAPLFQMDFRTHSVHFISFFPAVFSA